MDNFEALSVKAYRDNEIDNDYNVIDKYYFLKLKYLYLDYKCGKIIKEKAEIKKKKLRSEYIYDKKYYEKYLEICREYNDNRINIEYNLNKLEKSNDKDEILNISLEIIGKMINDENLAKRNLDKLTF